MAWVCAGKHCNAVSYSEVIVTVDDETICCRMKSYISEHLENLIDEFRRYFPDVVICK